MPRENDLIKKYNVNIPRYTSYPPLPVWDLAGFTAEKYKSCLLQSLKKSNGAISLYIHLPYCESLCTYCGCNTRITVNHKVETPYVDAVLKEWEMYINLFSPEKVSVAELHLGGGTPTFFSPENLMRLINGLKQTANFLPDADLSFEGHPNNTTYSHLKTLREAGFNRVSFGVQDFDQRVQIAINRVQPFEHVKQVMDWSRELGYTSVNLDLVYGLPFQTPESVMNTIEKVIELRPDRIAYYGYAHVPWVKPGQRMFGDDDIPSDNEKRKLFEIGKRKFVEVGYMQLGIDHFALPEDDLSIAFKNSQLKRNFMGYTTCASDVLIGLGVSSISDCGMAFAQNAKTVEDYLMNVDKGELSYVKGHIQSANDLLIKSIVFEIMCNLRTGRAAIENLYINHPEIKNKMRDFVSEGIIYFTANELRVTESGRPFLRNICASIDPYLTEANENAQVFSKAV